MPRASMSDLIARTRVLVADPLSATSAFTDDQIQDALDFWREEQRWVALRPQPTFTPGGSILYLDYYSGTPNWEADVVLQNMSYVTMTPALSELLIGHWAFTSQPDGIGVRATGKTYDLYASAADLLDWWAAQLKLTSVNFTAQGYTYHLLDQVQTIQKLGADYRSRALPHTRRLYQGDAAPDNDGGGVTYPSVGQVY